MNYKSLKGKIAIAFFSQIVSLIVSFFATFFLSKKLSVESYGYYQLFLFFSTYAGISQLGISQGVYLAIAGKEYDSLDKSEVKVFFLQATIAQFICLVVMMMVSLMAVTSANKLKVIICFVLYCIVYLFHNYWSGVLQSTNRSEITSLGVIVGKSVTFFSFLLLSILGSCSFVIYCVFYVLGEFVSAIVDMVYCRDILSYKIQRENILRLNFGLYSSGFILLLSTLMSSLILGVNRIIVENCSGIESFGKVSMSISLSNFVILFAIQIGMVLFPNFVNMAKREQAKYFRKIEICITFLIPMIFVAYWPFEIILSNWLPLYKTSVRWILLLIPYTILEIKNQILYNNLEKTYKDEKYLFLANFVAIFICSAVNYFVITKLGNFNIMFIVIDVAVSVKSIMLEYRVCKKIGIRYSIVTVFESLVLVVISFFLFNNYKLLYALILVPVYAVYCYFYDKTLDEA